MRGMRVVAAVIVLGMLSFGAGPAARAETTNGTITSKAPDHIEIGYTLFKPPGASSASKVPFILHSHGWAGSRTTTGFDSWLEAGFGVLSFDQRGFGESGGEATVQDPELEGYDVESIIDFVASLDWVQLDGPNDPVLGAIGGSYGGGYQTIGALSEILHHGSTRFNALAPEITWFDLPYSLAPNGVPKTAWNTLLYAVGAPAVPLYIHQSFAYGATTGQFPDGTVPGFPNLKQIFYEHSPHWFSDHGLKLDIPVLFGQGITDSLFTLTEAWHNFTEVLTPAAQSKSFVVGYNGGHILPEVFPPASNPAGDYCSGTGGFSALARSFFAKALSGASLAGFLPASFNLSANDGSTCIHTDSLSTYVAKPAGTIVTNTVIGAPIAYKLADGPIRVAGIPQLRGTLTAAVADARAFFALSVGTTQATATVVQNNLTPLRSLLPTVQQPFTMELAGVAVDVPAGQSLYLTVSPFDALSFGHGSKVPGVILIENATVDVPVA